MPILAALVVTLFEALVGLWVKVLAVRFLLQLVYVSICAATVYGVYLAINAALAAWVVPPQPSYVGTALFVINWTRLSVLVSLILGIEGTIAIGLFAIRQVKLLATH